MMKENPKLKEKFNKIAAEASLAREILPLLEHLQHSDRAIPPAPTERLQEAIREVFAPGLESKRDLRDLLARLETWGKENRESARFLVTFLRELLPAASAEAAGTVISTAATMVSGAARGVLSAVVDSRMTSAPETITVRREGLIAPEEWTIPAEPYVTLRDFVTSKEFLTVTPFNPNKLSFRVNEVSADDDLLLVPGVDVITFDQPGEKALMTARDVIKKLRRLVGLYFEKHGKKGHDHWRTEHGKRVDFPRHAGDLSVDTLRNIIRQAGLDMSIDEFVQA